MRRFFLLASGSLVLAAVVACAASDEEGSLAPMNDGGASPGPGPEAPAEAGATVDDDGGVRPRSSCNDVGWCATDLPDPDLSLKDIWPFEARAFAIAESDSLGTKVLEWTESTKSWAYVDDNSQNDYGSGHYAGKIWAPSENEVYYATAPGLIYHGTRANPSSPFAWDSARLAYEGPDRGPDVDPGRAWLLRASIFASVEYAPAIGVWGTSADDVYAWYGNRIFHRESVDGGPPTWVAEHVEEDGTAPDDTFYVFGAAGSSSDEVWFAASHGRYDAAKGFVACSTMLRRTPDGYTRVMDHALTNGSCKAKPGSLGLMFEVEIPGYGKIARPWTQPGWATSVASPRPGSAVAIVDNAFFAFVDTTGVPVARGNQIVGADPPTRTSNPYFHSVWINGDHAWFSGWGLVIDGENAPDVWRQCLGLMTPDALVENGIDGGATLSISSTALNGAPLDRPLYQVRGSSNDNLWAVGPRYALHKKTP